MTAASRPAGSAPRSAGRDAGRTLLRYAYVPLMLLGVNAVAIHLVGRGAPRAWLGALLLGAIGASLLVERLIPYLPDWNRSQGDAGRDVWHAAVNEAANAATVAILPFVASRAVVADVWPRAWPFGLQVVAAVLVLDAGITLTHYASHRVDLLWRFHAVHHSVRRFYGFNGLMKHPLHQLLELTVGAAPLVLVGVTPAVATALAFCVAVQLLLQHANVDYRVGPLRYVLALNEGHRFHHLKWPGVGDVNFGLFTLAWDHLLGTFSFDPARRFGSDDLGIGRWPRYPTRYLAQLAAPFGDQRRHAGVGPGAASPVVESRGER